MKSLQRRGPAKRRAHLAPSNEYVTPTKPTLADLRAAVGQSIPDLVAPGLDVLFCGINPGLYSAATGCHFARPGNRFWPALHAAGFTTRRLQPWERRALVACGCGVTNLVRRATVAAAELHPKELRTGARRLARKVARLQPRAVAIVPRGIRPAWRDARPAARDDARRDRLGLAEHERSQRESPAGGFRAHVPCTARRGEHDAWGQIPTRPDGRSLAYAPSARRIFARWW
jgi:double-stranded uracil-DNA glycosylase